MTREQIEAKIEYYQALLSKMDAEKDATTATEQTTERPEGLRTLLSKADLEQVDAAKTQIIRLACVSMEEQSYREKRTIMHLINQIFPDTFRPEGRK